MIKKNIKLFLQKRGFQIVKISEDLDNKVDNSGNSLNKKGFTYDVIHPYANYSPWLDDDSFLQTYKAIKDHTLVDIYRCYELWELTEQIIKLNNDAHFIEVGVWRGGTAGIIGKKLSLLNSKVVFYLADTFLGVVKTSCKDTFYKGGEHSDTSIEIVKSLIYDKYNNYKILEGIFPDETSSRILDDHKFGFCHIDVDVYNSAKGIVDWIWQKMIVGGVVVFDDYGFHTCDGITIFVNEQRRKEDRIVIHNLNGHAVILKLK